MGTHRNSRKHDNHPSHPGSKYPTNNPSSQHHLTRRKRKRKRPRLQSHDTCLTNTHQLPLPSSTDTVSFNYSQLVWGPSEAREVPLSPGVSKTHHLRPHGDSSLLCLPHCGAINSLGGRSRFMSPSAPTECPGQYLVSVVGKRNARGMARARRSLESPTVLPWVLSSLLQPQSRS